MAGLMAEARLRGTAVTLAAAGRSASVTTAITYEERVGTSICESAARTRRRPSAHCTDGANAAAIRQRLDGMCVYTIVLMSPMRLPIHAATGKENAESTPLQKKKAPAAARERSKRWKSQSARSECTTKPPAKESMAKSAASL